MRVALSTGLLTVVLGLAALPPSKRTLDEWFNTAAFNRNPAQQLA